MKQFVLSLLLMGAAFVGAYYVGQTHLRNTAPPVCFTPSSYPEINRPFVVVVIGYNNGAYVEKTLASIESQNYSNFRIVYIDDASTDGTCDLVKQLIYNTDKSISFIQNQERIGVLSNLSQVVRDSLDDEIITVVGGEDWLAHEWVLSRLNQYYANPDLWITYGPSCEYPEYTVRSQKTPSRENDFEAVRLSSFYAGLFKEIGIERLFEGEPITDASIDMAYMIPMLEMAEGHASFIPEVLYVSNQLVGKKEDSEGLSRCEKIIREMAAYEPLSKWGSAQ